MVLPQILQGRTIGKKTNRHERIYSTACLGDSHMRGNPSGAMRGDTALQSKPISASGCLLLRTMCVCYMKRVTLHKSREQYTIPKYLASQKNLSTHFSSSGMITAKILTRPRIFLYFGLHLFRGLVSRYARNNSRHMNLRGSQQRDNDVERSPCKREMRVENRLSYALPPLILRGQVILTVLVAIQRTEQKASETLSCVILAVLVGMIAAGRCSKSSETERVKFMWVSR